MGEVFKGFETHSHGGGPREEKDSPGDIYFRLEELLIDEDGSLDIQVIPRTKIGEVHIARQVRHTVCQKSFVRKKHFRFF